MSTREINHESTGSSPRPKSEVDPMEDHQRSQDAGSAQAMASRPRSNTVLTTRDPAVLPRRVPSPPGIAVRTDVTPARRRGSVSFSQPHDHLADDLEIDLLQQNRQFSGGRPNLVNRFYRLQRNLSDSSIDSAGGAFIDHRRQQQLPPSTTLRTERSGFPKSPYGYSDLRGGGRRPSTISGKSEIHKYSEDDGRGRLFETSPIVDSGDLDEDAIVSDGGLNSPPALPRKLSADSYRSVRSKHGDKRHTGNYPDNLSRHGSFVNEAEEDVCFPAHNGEAGMDMYGDHPHGGGAAGLHAFSYPFDFQTLQEFADREKETTSIIERGRDAPKSPVPAFMPGDSHHSFRQRKLSESYTPDRKRRTLFETVAPINNHSGSDTKTPLLIDKNQNAYGAAGKVNKSSAGSAGKPYRFSFYSNALPSTIHARSLGEIPASGQTFEELFQGQNSEGLDKDSHDKHGSLLNDLKSPLNGSMKGTATGTSTPQVVKPRTGITRTDLEPEENTWWLDVLSPTDQEMKILSKTFGIHPLTTEDIQMEETREKIELFRNYYFVCFRSFEQDPYSPYYLEPLNMYIIVFREGTLSFHFRGTPHPQSVRRRIKQLKDYINVTSDWISYALIDDITDAFGPLIQNIEYEVDSIDELVLILKEAEQSDMLRRIGTCRKKVMGLLRLMGNKADVVRGLYKRCNENWSVAPKSDIGLYLSDIQDHITTSTQNLAHYEKILSRSHSNYLAQISIEMTDANNQINDVLSKLTALGTVLIPMNLVTGLWGMNVRVPGEGGDNLNWFFSIVGCLGAIALGGAWLTYRVFVRQ